MCCLHDAQRQTDRQTDRRSTITFHAVKLAEEPNAEDDSVQQHSHS